MNIDPRAINFRSVRIRTSLAAAGSLLALILVIGLLTNWFVARQINDSLDQTLLAQAEDRVTLLEAGGDPMNLISALGEEVIVVIADSSGTVLASAGTPTPDAVVDLQAGVHDVAIVIIESDNGEVEEPHTEELRAAVAISSSGQRVIVGNERGSTGQALGTIRTGLLIGGPLVGLLAAALVWSAVNRALAPVSRMQADLDAVVRASDGRRVQDPQTGDEIAGLASTMNEVLGRLDQESVARRQFVADASHELKSPLANARILLETRDAGPLNQEVADQVNNELDRLKDIVDDLLFLARVDETTSTDHRPFDLDDVLFDEAERLAPTRGVTIDASGVQPSPALGDRSEITRAVRNLLENAVRHATSIVAIHVNSSETQHTVIIDDDGSGIAEADRERIFERFTRLDDARTRGDGGSGLGLSIVATIATRNGGSVDVGESPRGGARFALSIPAQ